MEKQAHYATFTHQLHPSGVARHSPAFGSACCKYRLIYCLPKPNRLPAMPKRSPGRQSSVPRCRCAVALCRFLFESGPCIGRYWSLIDAACTEYFGMGLLNGRSVEANDTMVACYWICTGNSPEVLWNRVFACGCISGREVMNKECGV